jgi:hypothetical protein
MPTDIIPIMEKAIIVHIIDHKLKREVTIIPYQKRRRFIEGLGPSNQEPLSA